MQPSEMNSVSSGNLDLTLTQGRRRIYQSGFVRQLKQLKLDASVAHRSKAFKSFQIRSALSAESLHPPLLPASFAPQQIPTATKAENSSN